MTCSYARGRREELSLFISNIYINWHFPYRLVKNHKRTLHSCYYGWDFMYASPKTEATTHNMFDRFLASLQLNIPLVFSVHLSGLHSLFVLWSLAEAQCDFQNCWATCQRQYSIDFRRAFCDGSQCKCGKLHQCNIYPLATKK
jgi:hypothetical protein